MGLKELFIKESKCEKCGISIPKKDLAEYDTTHQGQNKYGNIKKVCNSCLMEMFYDSLKSFNETAVVISPIQGMNAYVTYNFDKLLNTKQSSHTMEENNKKFINELIELLPQNNTKCSCCEDKATYTWCSSELLNNDPFSWEINRYSGLEPIYLCKKCLINKFKEEMEKENIRFELIYPPLKGDGFICSWEI